MKKRVMSMLLVLCMVFAMAPTMAVAAKTDVDKRTIEMKVKERKKYDGPPATNFASSNQDVVTVYQDGEIVAKQAGTGTIYAYKNSKTVAAWTIKVGGGKPAARPENTGGWPFVPSPDNKTNGYIHSGWYRIYTHDLGLWHVDEDGIVIPTRRVEYAFYIEHLGNDVYYIYDPTGRYLSYQGDAKSGAQIVMSETPRKWRVRENFDGQKRYVFTTMGNDKLALMTFGLCSETSDSRVKLSEQGVDDHYKAEYTLQGEGLEHYIPQWYKDFENGLSKPSTTKPVKMFGDPPAALKYTVKQEWDVLRITNNERAKEGLPMLVTTDAMQKVAGVRSDELMKKYSHTRPNGSEPFTVFSAVGIAFQDAAENIAKNQGLAESVVQDWMDSPGHRANILTPGLRYMGTGRSYNTEAHWVQIFATTANSNCKSISYNREQGYFTLKLNNGATAYAPYAKDTPPESYEAVTFNYPGVKTIQGGEGNRVEKEHPFTDVKAGSYYEDSVVWALKNNVTSGTSATTFSPDATSTRGQVVTFLWRAKGSPEPKSTRNPFADVKSNDYYYKAVLWAVENGITSGTGATTFSPADTCTSGQVVTFLWRSNGSPASTGASAPYYAKAVSWAEGKHLLDDMGRFSADKPSPRSDIATYLYRNAK